VLYFSNLFSHIWTKCSQLYCVWQCLEDKWKHVHVQSKTSWLRVASSVVAIFMYGRVARDVTLHGIYTKMPVAPNCDVTLNITSAQTAQSVQWLGCRRGFFSSDKMDLACYFETARVMKQKTLTAMRNTDMKFPRKQPTHLHAPPRTCNTDLTELDQLNAVGHPEARGCSCRLGSLAM